MRFRASLFRTEVRTRLRSLDGAEERREGARIAEAIAHFPGVYLITPFLEFGTTTELAKFARKV